jgi:putative spermidine/putrescine transport system substrate-binding protein
VERELNRRGFLGVAAGAGGALFLAACGSGSGGGGTTAGGGSSRAINFVGYGGTTQDAQMRSWAKAYTDATGGRVNAVSPTDYGKLKAMVESGNVTWDAVVVEGFFAHDPANAALFTKLDKAAMNTSALDAVAGDGPPGDQVTDHSVACYEYAFCWAYRTDSKKKRPGNWSEFFDTGTFPGTRALYGNPYGTLEIALLADGVAWDDMYPLDVDRALAKLKTLKGNVQYWTGGAESQQFLIGGSADFVVVWDTRAVVLAGQGQPVAVEWEQNIRTADHLIIPKGSKATTEASKFISSAILADPQAEYANQVSSSPANPQSYPKISKTVFPNLAVAHSEQAAGHISNEYWGENYTSVLEKFNEVVAA